MHGASIDEAVARIGTRATYTISPSFSLISGNTMRVETGFDLLACWSRSLAVAANGTDGNETPKSWTARLSKVFARI
ncbi:hypothetical protein ASA1KI_30870 [Opitutales bacterium ASA1]|uniref:hypothetical protein n=1 Tax=Congregicoccus parvus TaxID=3081749 RepID=UPI002B2B6E46|nr:hypothetical protein ASA1KI_30870 [Opitutales bacterium ASA1]